MRFERAPPEKETKPKTRNVRVSLHCAIMTELKMESYFMYTNSAACLDIVRMDMDISCHVVHYRSLEYPISTSFKLIAAFDALLNIVFIVL